MLVGAQLRRLRAERGLSREEAAAAIRASAWKIHRLENGQVGFKDRDVVDLLGLYGVADPARVAAFVAVAREANEPGWWQPFGELLPGWFRPYVDLESAATLIRSYEGQFVPGLLQTEEYMRAVFRGALTGEPDGELERRVRLRVARQAVLRGIGGPRLWVVMDEAALRRQVGGTEVMRVQLEWLLEVAQWAGVVLQVLPFGVGAHPAMVGSFSILRFADAQLSDVVYLEQLTNAVYLEKRDDVDRYLHVMEGVCVRAAQPDQTVRILRAVLRDGW